MKNKTKIIIALMALCAVALTFSACSVWDTPFVSLDKGGYTVSVRYDINGGQFASNNNVNIVDTFSLASALKGVKLVEPGSSLRGEQAANSTASRSGYFLEGWYKTRTLRFDANGNPLDDEGNICYLTESGEYLSASGKSQGYVYSDKWDFDKDVLIVDEGNYSSEEAYLTLYAAWIPNFNYNFYSKTESGEWELALTYTVNPTLQGTTLTIPYWKDLEDGVDPTTCSGAMEYGNFPTVSGKTFSAVYSDSSMTQKIEGKVINHSGSVDEATGTAISPNNDFYVEYIDGNWFHIYTAKQFIDNARISGCYEIFADIDFSDVQWSNGLSRGDFTGTIVGNGHKFSNITVTQNDYSQLRGGLFGRIMESATIKDLTFENVSYNLNAASRYSGAEFGLFAGHIDSNASIENVSVSGTLHIGNVYDEYSNYTVGLLCSNIVSIGDSFTTLTYDIDCVLDIVVSGSTQSYPHTATVENGVVKLSINATPDVDPNQKTDETVDGDPESSDGKDDGSNEDISNEVEIAEVI